MADRRTLAAAAVPVRRRSAAGPGGVTAAAARVAIATAIVPRILTNVGLATGLCPARSGQALHVLAMNANARKAASPPLTEPWATTSHGDHSSTQQEQDTGPGCGDQTSCKRSPLPHIRVGRTTAAADASAAVATAAGAAFAGAEPLAATAGPAGKRARQLPERSDWIPLLRCDRQATTWPSLPAWRTVWRPRPDLGQPGRHSSRPPALTRAALSGTACDSLIQLGWGRRYKDLGPPAVGAAAAAASAGDGATRLRPGRRDCRCGAIEAGLRDLRVAGGCNQSPPGGGHSVNLRPVGGSVRAEAAILKHLARL